MFVRTQWLPTTQGTAQDLFLEHADWHSLGRVPKIQLVWPEGLALSVIPSLLLMFDPRGDFFAC